MSGLGLSARLGLGALLFFAGYSFCLYVHADERYSIQRKNGVAYLYDQMHDTSLAIDDKSFQVGTLEYRLEGILRDRRLPQVLATLSEDEGR